LNGAASASKGCGFVCIGLESVSQRVDRVRLSPACPALLDDVRKLVRKQPFTFYRCG
jgi:hypothetical protein